MEPPIACTLGSTEYTDRTARLRELAESALRSREPIPDGERLSFAPGAETESRLHDVVLAEASCCPFLRMDLRCADDAIVLEITGHADARLVIAELFR